MYIYIYIFFFLIYWSLLFIYLSKLPAARLHFGLGRRGGCAKERFHVGEGPRRLFCRCFVEMGALRIFMLKRFKMHMNRKGYPTLSKWSQKGAKVSQGTFKNKTCGTASKQYWIFMIPRMLFGIIFDQSLKTPYQKSSPKTITPEHWIWFQRGAKMESKPMPKLIKN